MKNKIKTIGALGFAIANLTFAQQDFAANAVTVSYHTVKVDGLNLFYREAGDPSCSTIVLLHGFPSSSHMYRNLIPRLAAEYHVVAPDFPGYGYSDQPAEAVFGYTFDHLAAVTDDLLNALTFRTTEDYPAGVRWAFG